MSRTRFSVINVAICFFAILLIGSAAWADNSTDWRQKLFEMDKVAALADFTTSQKQACVDQFQSRYPLNYRLSSNLVFNEKFSLTAYDQLFWKGEGSLQRGLLFTGSVVNQSGNKVGELVCYYAMTDYRLEFQSAYVLPLHKENIASGVLPSDQSYVTASTVKE